MDSTIATSPATFRAISAITVKVVTALNLSATTGEDVPRAAIIEAAIVRLSIADGNRNMNIHFQFLFISRALGICEPFSTINVIDNHYQKLQSMAK